MKSVNEYNERVDRRENVYEQREAGVRRDKNAVNGGGNSLNRDGYITDRGRISVNGSKNTVNSGKGEL